MDEHDALRFSFLPEAREVLRQVRQSPDIEHWQNAIIIEGLVGDVDAWRELADFLQEDYRQDGGIVSPLPEDVFRAKMSVLRALGFLSKQSGGQTRTEIVAYLKAGVIPSAWNARVSWKSPHEEEDDNRVRNLQLSEKSIIALGLSGDISAGGLLRSIKARLARARYDDDGHARFASNQWTNELLDDQSVDDLLRVTSEALQINQQLQRKSLRAYLPTDDVQRAITKGTPLTSKQSK